MTMTEDELDDLRYTYHMAEEAIRSWKAHQLRSVRQDRARTDILATLEDSSVLITQDWAMKFLPQKYRESQSDWFGKRGISWHISVAARTRSYFSEGNSVSFPERYSKSEKGWDFDILRMRSPGMRGDWHVLKPGTPEHPGTAEKPHNTEFDGVKNKM